MRLIYTDLIREYQSDLLGHPLGRVAYSPFATITEWPYEKIILGELAEAVIYFNYS
jgi:hypothetical protein